MYYSSKSDLLKEFKQIAEVILEPPLEGKRAMVVDSVIVNGLSNRKSIKPKTFGEYSEYVFYGLNNLSKRYCMRS